MVIVLGFLRLHLYWSQAEVESRPFPERRLNLGKRPFWKSWPFSSAAAKIGSEATPLAAAVNNTSVRNGISEVAEVTSTEADWRSS